MSVITSKIRIDHVQGANILSTTDYESLLELGLLENNEFGNYEIEIGKQIRVNDENYIVKSVYTIIYKQVVNNKSNKGITVSAIGERNDFNIEIVYYVDDLR